MRRGKDSHLDRTRPLSEPHLLRRAAPFLVVLVIDLLAVLPGLWHGRPGTVLAACALSAALLAAGALVPWRRLPAWTESLVPIGFVGVALLVRDQEQGPIAGAGSLAVLPIVWLALYGTRREVAAAAATATTQFLLPAVLDDPGIDSWVDVLLWSATALAIGLVVHALTSHRRAQSAQLAATRAALRRDNAALAAERDFTDTVLANADSLVVVLDRNGGIVRFNRACEQLTGWPPDEALGRSVLDLVPESRRARLRAGMGALTPADFPLAHEDEWLGRDGLRRIAWSASQLGDERGGIAFIVATGTDVTDRRLAEEAVRASEQRFQTMAANVPGMVFQLERTTDGTFRLPFVSEACGALYGIEPAEATAEALAALTHPEDRALLLRSVVHSADRLTPLDRHWRILRADGAVRWLHGTARPRTEPGGTLVWDGMVVDETPMREAQARRRELQERLSLVVENLPDSAVVLCDADLTVQFCEGPLFAHLDAEPVEGRRLCEVVSDEAFSALEPGLSAALLGDGSSTVLPVEGDEPPLALHFAPYHADDGSVQGALIHWQDITALRAAEDARGEAEHRLAVLFDRASIGMAVVSADGRFEAVNRALCALTGISEEALRAMDPRTLVHADDAEDVEAALAALAEGGDQLCIEHRVVHASGEPVWVQTEVVVVRDRRGRRVDVLLQVQDITERRRYEERLEHLAHHDPLTGLVNRRALEAALDGHLARVRRHGPEGALLVLDLDGFKFVNDALGHAAGDELIATCATALAGRLRETDVLARLGGDEFAVLLADGDLGDAQRVAGDLVDAVRRGAAGFSDRHLGDITASVGVATFDDGGLTGEEMLINADLAMYEAKDAGKDRYAVHAEGHVPRMRTDMTWLERIRRALAEDRFVLHAQPIVDLRRDCVHSSEVLLRMLDEHGETLPPSSFLHVAERFGLIRDIDRWVVRRAVRAMAAECAAGRRLPLAVNVSGASTGDPALVELIESELRAGGVDPADLTLEITETAAVADIPRARVFATALQDLGCRFALDDFGAGFGAFTYLKHLPFDVLKIDGEFVKRATVNTTDRLIISAVCDIAKGMGKQTVAEFVPDDETVRLLLDHNVDFGQGHHLGRPEPLELSLAGVG